MSKTIVIIAALFPLISISAMQAVRAVLGYTLDRIFRVLETRIVHWSGRD